MNRWRDKTFGDFADALRLYRPFIGVVLALLLVAIVLPGSDVKNALSAADDKSGVQNFDAAGDGTTQSTVAGTADTSGTAFAGSTGTGSSSSSSGAGGALRVGTAAASNPNCDPATGRIKVPTIYAPPCVPVFSGDNGGATYQGITAKTIKIVVYLAQEDPASGALLERGGNRRLPRRGQGHVPGLRRLLPSALRDLRAQDRAGLLAGEWRRRRRRVGARRDAIKVATEIKAFMSWGGRVLTNAYQDELAARGVPCICTKAPPVEYGLEHAPYYYSRLMFSTQAYVHRAEYIGKMVYGQQGRSGPEIRCSNSRIARSVSSTPRRPRATSSRASTSSRKNSPPTAPSSTTASVSCSTSRACRNRRAR